MKKIGFIGLGHMGMPMAHNLLTAGFEVHTFDVADEAIKQSVQYGAIAGKSPGDIANEVDLLITMVQTGDQVKAICLGEKGVFKHLKKNALYIDSSSIDISVTKELHKICKQQEINMLDAPVSGGVAGAEAASLTIMVGGDENIFNLAKPILSHLGKKIIHAGKAGTGQAAKICNNLLLGISMIGVSEAFNLAEKLGLEAKKFFEISSNSSGQCWSMTSYCPAPGILENVPSSHQYQAGFMAKMMLKDLDLGHQAALQTNTSTPLGDHARKIYKEYVSSGEGEKDFSGIIEYLKKL